MTEIKIKNKRKIQGIEEEKYYFCRICEPKGEDGKTTQEFSLLVSEIIPFLNRSICLVMY